MVARLSCLRAFVGGREGSRTRGNASRGDANLVRVDVYPVTEDGQAVTDLTADDFEVREDNVPQAVATFEHVSCPEASHDARPRADRRWRAARALAPGERARIVVVFLDTYHTDTVAVARAIHSAARAGCSKPRWRPTT